MNGSIRLLRIPLLICIAVLASSGCAVMSKQDCLEGNWREAGNNDAVRGHPSSSRLASRIIVCQKHGAAPNKVDYLLGYKVGIQHYCQPERGLIAGSNNHTYRGICPTELEPSYLQHYISGLKVARRDAWFRYQWVDSELFSARIHHRSHNRDNNDKRLRVEARIDRLSHKLHELRSEQFQIDRKIALWTARLKNI